MTIMTIMTIMTMTTRPTRPTRAIAPWVPLWLSIACGPGAGTSGETGSSGGDSTGPASTGTTTLTSTTGTTAEDTGTTAASTTAIDDTATEDSGPTGTDTGDPACPAPQEVAADFTVVPPVDPSATCTVIFVGEVDGGTAIDLDCEGDPAYVWVATAPDPTVPWLAVGDPVHLDYVVEPIFWENRWFALHSAMGESDVLLLGGVSGSALDPPGTTLEAFFGGDPGLTVVEGLCEPFDDLCGPVERLALDLTTLGGATVRVFDQDTGIIDVLAYGYRLTVQSAVHNLRPIGCDDLPPRWYQLVVGYFPSD
ncbi:MAG: hypothetical protein KDK70_24580 [Myxococcales bacterium]|nr:hypothetical protein [Myxococcales bacterium]